MDLFSKKVEAQVILLDYQCTLVENHEGRRAWYEQNFGKSYAEWIRQEVYRQWLIGLLDGKTVVLITARKECWRRETMARLAQCATGLKFDMLIFNEGDHLPHDWKRLALVKYVFPKYGLPDRCAFIGLESNANTRAMYAQHGIYSVRVPEAPPYWDLLPKTEIGV